MINGVCFKTLRYFIVGICYSLFVLPNALVMKKKGKKREKNNKQKNEQTNLWTRFVDTDVTNIKKE